mgnify:FL=1
MVFIITVLVINCLIFALATISLALTRDNTTYDTVALFPNIFTLIGNIIALVLAVNG